MTLGGKKEALALLVGDWICFTLALWLTLWVRYSEVPSLELFERHLLPFSYLFIAWTIIFFIFDLYRKRTIITERALGSLIVRAQVFNSLLAALCFYFIPYYSRVGLTPKTNLFIDLIITLALIFLWRRYWSRFVYHSKPLTIAFACAGAEVDDLKREITSASQYNLRVVESSNDVRAALVVFDTYDTQASETMPRFYRQLFHGVRFVSVQNLYEEIFGRVPLSLISEQWFLEQVSYQNKFAYDVFKRLMDICLGIILFVVALPFSLLACLAIRLDDGGAVFIVQDRIGKDGKPVRVYKFRTMTGNDQGNYHEGKTVLRETRVGHVLRRTRIDEFPQFWNVIKGDLSLVGPRPELPALAQAYEQEVPHYRVRHLIKPGLSGWAQIYHDNHPHHGKAVEQTREKLSYDLYYVKNRNLWLDLKIALKTVKALLLRTGA